MATGSGKKVWLVGPDPGHVTYYDLNLGIISLSQIQGPAVGGTIISITVDPECNLPIVVNSDNSVYKLVAINP